MIYEKEAATRGGTRVPAYCHFLHNSIVVFEWGGGEGQSTDYIGPILVSFRAIFAIAQNATDLQTVDPHRRTLVFPEQPV